MGHLGILSLDTAFPRIVGDAGNPLSYQFEAVVKVVRDADPSLVVSDEPLPNSLNEAFVRAAIELEAEGAKAIVSTCGFLIHAQDLVAQAVRIPVMLSPLSLYPLIQITCPGTIGILTASASALGSNALAAAGIDKAAIAGMDHHSLFRETFLAEKSAQRTTFAPAELEALVLQEARALVDQRPLSALLLECGNLPPYARKLRSELGLPVFSALEAANLIMAS